MQANVRMVILAQAEDLCIGIFCSQQWLWVDASVIGKRQGKHRQCHSPSSIFSCLLTAEEKI